MSKLRLGPVVDEKPVKMTIEITGMLHRELGEYARVHAMTNNLVEPLSAERLIPPMVDRFISGDREFNKLRRRT